MRLPNPVSRAVRRSAWGYFFLYLYLNLSYNSVSIGLLPTFVGWYLLGRSVRVLKGERPQLELLEGFASGLGIWAVLEWLPWGAVGVDFPGLLAPVDLLAAAAAMYFQFHFLTEISRLALDRLGEAGPLHSARLLRARTWAVVLQAATIVFARVFAQTVVTSGTGRWEQARQVLAAASGGAAVLLMLADFVFCLYVMFALFALAKGLEDPQ